MMTKLEANATSLNWRVDLTTRKGAARGREREEKEFLIQTISPQVLDPWPHASTAIIGRTRPPFPSLAI